MKHERVNQLIAAIRDGLPGIEFDMRHWMAGDTGDINTKCACIAGHAAILAVGVEKARTAIDSAGLSEVPRIAAEWLGLSKDLADRLFGVAPITSQNTDRAWAVSRLKSLKLEDA